MLKLTIGLFVAMALIYGLTQVVPKRFGDAVASRFLERGQTSRQYTAESLARWVTEYGSAAKGYAVPVLFPLDLLFMACLAGFVAVASIGLAEATDRLGDVAWRFAFLPGRYLAVDLGEDVLLASFLLSPARITTGAVEAAHVLTTIKVWALGLGRSAGGAGARHAGVAPITPDPHQRTS
jgi:hypothetical protein